MNLFNFPLYHWHFEISSKCTLRCPRCPRTKYRGLYNIGELALDEIKAICDQPEFSQRALKVTLCGGQGDPIYHSRFLDVVRYLKSFSTPKILTIVTNGSHKSPEWWAELKGLMTPGDDVVISVDGFDAESNQIYRVGSNWTSIIDGINAMVGGPAMIIWNAIYFRFNQHKIEEIKSLAQSLGADGFRLTKSEIFGSKYPELIDPELKYDPLEPQAELVSSNHRMQKKMVWFDQNSDRSLLMGKAYREFNRARSQCLDAIENDAQFEKFLPNCLFGFRGNYVDADGYFYPCSWVSHPNTHFESNSYRKKLFESHKDKFNLKLRPLAEVLVDPIWNKLARPWTDLNFESVLECSNKCSREHVLEAR